MHPQQSTRSEEVAISWVAKMYSAAPDVFYFLGGWGWPNIPAPSKQGGCLAWFRFRVSNPPSPRGPTKVVGPAVGTVGTRRSGSG